ncbi:MAG: hypothetical protein HXS40_05740 [Theionarchaea archaeon]|nr:hypothetical protein [Theionarchaea archaeon]
MQESSFFFVGFLYKGSYALLLFFFCIFISCTDIRAAEIIDSLERRLRKPVINSNLATLWHVLKLEQLNLSLKGYGKLLEAY